jgi:hypothetical protein
MFLLPSALCLQIDSDDIEFINKVAYNRRAGNMNVHPSMYVRSMLLAEISMGLL